MWSWKKARQPTLPRNVVASWMWGVFAPQIEHCNYELQVLERTLTFRANTRIFERLAPLRSALLPEGQHIFDDMRGELPEYDRLVTMHDGALAELLRRAQALYDALVASDEFRRVFREVVEQVR